MSQLFRQLKIQPNDKKEEANEKETEEMAEDSWENFAADDEEVDSVSDEGHHEQVKAVCWILLD